MVPPLRQAVRETRLESAPMATPENEDFKAESGTQKKSHSFYPFSNDQEGEQPARKYWAEKVRSLSENESEGIFGPVS
jgi:hypothetical protein